MAHRLTLADGEALVPAPHDNLRAGQTETMADTAIFDVDGTLVDTNHQHALAWFRAFRHYGITLPMWRIHRGIGMGGDMFVLEVAGLVLQPQIAMGFAFAFGNGWCGRDVGGGVARSTRPRCGRGSGRCGWVWSGVPGDGGSRRG
jgi:hypothetical protein